MRSLLTVVSCVLLLLATGEQSAAGAGGTAAAVVADPVRAIAVTGTGVSLGPDFDPAVHRYAIRTSVGTGGAVTVDATTSDVAGRVLVDGVPRHGPVALTGLEPGEEVAVTIQDAGGTTSYALVYLPADFPQLVPSVARPGTAEGEVLLTIGNYATAVDRNGVPVYLHDFGAATADFKPVAGGGYSVMRLVGGVNNGSEGDWDLVELDAALRAVRTIRTVGLRNTDSHDSVLRPDGSRILVAYEPDAAGTRLDPVIQEVDAAGDVVLTWNGADHLQPLTETTAGTEAGVLPRDWAHVNSIQELENGDLLVSFRHLSAVLRIAWAAAHDGFARGEVVWRLGGRHNDYTFVDDPYGGPCAQHTATLLPGDHLLVFDNGSGALGANPSYCVDPDDRTGPTVDRPTTRVTEYALDEDAHTATLVWSYPLAADRFTYFAGSAQRLPGGNTLIEAIPNQGPGPWTEVLEVGPRATPDEAPLWRLASPAPWSFSYRASKAEVPDAIAPKVRLALPAGGRYDVGDRVSPDFGCTDAGGSTLQSCTAPGGLVTSSAGRRTLTVTAVDGDGNATSVERAYVVTSPRPEVAVRTPGGWRRSATLALPRKGARDGAALRVTNRSVHARRVEVRGHEGGPSYDLRYRFDGRDVTRAVLAGTWRTPELAPGASVRLTVVAVRRTVRAAYRESAVAARLRLDRSPAASTSASTSASVTLRLRPRR